MNINDLTIGQAKELTAMFNKVRGGASCSVSSGNVVVCTDRRAVVAGYSDDTNARPIVLKNARMCIYWDRVVGGVLGLADVGPNNNCRISATAPSITLEGVTAVMGMTPKAVEAWLKAPVQGR